MGVDGSLAAEQRQQFILDLLKTVGRVDIGQAAEELDVHPMTIRRDLKALERDGAARLVRGGATFVGPQRFDIRRARALRAKRRIAEKLMPIVRRHDSVGIDASTTLLTLAESMPQLDHLLVVTYGIESFQVLCGRTGVQAFLSGGELDHRTGSLVGPVAQRSLAGFSLSCSILSTSALDPEIGTMEPTVEEVGMKQAMARASNQVVLALHSTKLAQRSAVRALAFDQVSIVVTELDPADERLDPYRDLVQLI
jgi:DeoR family fructose operon transcriptional repressor